jgi:hypothetical protein
MNDLAREKAKARWDAWVAKDGVRERIKVTKRRAYEKAAARVATLKAKPCMDCGGMFPPECMDFDHRDPASKTLTGVQFYVNSEKVAAEIAKCDLVCANCHRTRTKRRRRG